MFPLWHLWATQWLDLQPPGWSPPRHQLSLWFTLTSTGRSSGSQRGYGERENTIYACACMCVCVCGKFQSWGTFQGSQPGPEGWPWEEGPLVLREGFWKDYWETKMFSLWLKETSDPLDQGRFGWEYFCLAKRKKKKKKKSQVTFSLFIFTHISKWK